MPDLTDNEINALLQDTAPSEMSDADIDSLLGAAKIEDENTGEILPAKLSGDSPDSPTNDPAVDLTDRFKLALGNDQGRVEYLKTKYEDAALNTNGNLVVKKDGKWSYVDPRGFGQKDPWELSKEVLADAVADSAGEILIGGTAAAGGIAGTAVAPAAGTAGGAITGAALGEYMRSSLGRIVGTYNADPIQQTKDIAFESMLQLAGEKFIPGMKKPVAKLADGVEKLAGKAGTKLAQFYGRMNVGQDAMDSLLKHGKKVPIKMKEIARLAGTDDARYADEIKLDSIRTIEKVGKSAQKILSGTYNKFRAEIVNSVPENFVARPSKLAVDAYEEMVVTGISTVKRKGKELANPQDIANTFKIARETGRLPKGTTIELKSQAQLKNFLQKTGQFDNDLLQVAQDGEAYKILAKAHKAFDSISTAASTKGKAGAANLMEAKKQLGSVLGAVESQAKEKNFNSLRSLVGNLRKSTENGIKNSFKEVGLDSKYAQMNTTYGQLKDALNPLVQTERRASGASGQQAYESLINQLSARPGKNVARKGSLSAIADAAETLNDREAAKFLRSAQDQLNINDAALAFNPYINKRGTAAAGIATYAAFSANAPLGAAVAIGAAAGSPQVAKTAVRSSQVMWNGLKTLKSMSAQQLDQLTKNEQLSSAFINSLVNGAEIGQNIENELMSRIPE